MQSLFSSTVSLHRICSIIFITEAWRWIGHSRIFNRTYDKEDIMARNNLTRANPRGGMARSGLLPSGIEDLFREFALAPALRELEAAPRMRVDVEENDQAYILRAEIPGARKEDIVVNIDANTVTIRADVVEERSDQQGRNMIRSERMFGEEVRSFTFPQEVDESKVEARYENGILILTLPKKTGGSGRRLTVQ
jgi:HSP20 family protein